jgi:hypothetical protein
MMDKTGEEDVRKTFRQLIDDITTYKPENLLRKELGAINFADSEHIFRRIYNFFEAAKSVNWETVPPENLQTLTSQGGHIRNRLIDISRFNLEGDQPAHTKRMHADNLDRAWISFYREAVPLLAFEMVGGSSNPLDSFREASRLAISEVVSVFTSTKQEMAAVKKELETELASVKLMRKQAEDEARQKGVIKEAVHFKKLADWATGISIGWVVLALVMAGVTLYYAWHSSTLSIQNLGTSPNLVIAIATMLPRLITITILLTGLVFCLRNFAAMSHNRVVNRHRQTALTTFQTFATSTDGETKNAVLLQATQAIFQPQPSGYLKTDNEIQPQVSLVADVIRGSGGKPEK